MGRQIAQIDYLQYQVLKQQQRENPVKRNLLMQLRRIQLQNNFQL